MDAFDFLKRQHAEAADLFSRQQATRGKERLSLLVSLVEALTVHAALEERFLYPLARQHGLDAAVNAATDAHDQVRRLALEILDTKVGDPKLDAKVEILRTAVSAHVADEEGRIFPALRAEGAVLGSHVAELEEAARELQWQPLLLVADNEAELAQS